MRFLAAFLTTALVKVLKERPADTRSPEQVYKFVANNFAEMKTKVQVAVAASFESAMSHHTGRSVEYFCRVSPVPESVNKEPC